MPTKVLSSAEQASDFCDWMNEQYPNCFVSWDKLKGFDRFICHWINGDYK